MEFDTSRKNPDILRAVRVVESLEAYAQNYVEACHLGAEPCCTAVIAIRVCLFHASIMRTEDTGAHS